MDVRRVLGKVKKYGFKRSVEKVAQDFLFFPKKYYSGSGEDVMLQYYCPQNTGFYVDVGAYHPKRASVTRMFYRRGWHGINIEPNPNAIKAFKRLRRRDININIGVSDKVGELDYYYWGKSHPGNTFDAELYKKWTEGFGHGPEKIMKIKVDTLNNILANNLPEGTVIDFLTIDVEGYELRILESLDYDKYSPRFIAVEDLSFYDKNKNFMECKDSDLYKLLSTKGYVVVSKTWYTILFKKVE